MENKCRIIPAWDQWDWKKIKKISAFHGTFYVLSVPAKTVVLIQSPYEAEITPSFVFTSSPCAPMPWTQIEDEIIAFQSKYFKV